MERKFLSGAILFAALVIAVLWINAPASAAPRATGYTIDWYTIDGGGAQDLTGGSYTLSGTIGQNDAGAQSGGNYKLNGGFWGFLDSLRSLFLPLIIR